MPFLRSFSNLSALIGVQTVLVGLHTLLIRGIFSCEFGVSGQRNVLIHQDILHLFDVHIMGGSAISHRYSGGDPGSLTSAHALGDHGSGIKVRHQVTRLVLGWKKSIGTCRTPCQVAIMSSGRIG